MLFAVAVPASTVAARRIPDEVRASGLGLCQSVLVASEGFGALAAGSLATLLGLRTTIVLALTAAAVAGAIAAVFSPRPVHARPLVATPQPVPQPAG